MKKEEVDKMGQSLIEFEQGWTGLLVTLHDMCLQMESMAAVLNSMNDRIRDNWLVWRGFLERNDLDAKPELLDTVQEQATALRARDELLRRCRAFVSTCRCSSWGFTKKSLLADIDKLRGDEDE